MNVYWFQDSKIGHLKQVQALLDQLKKEMKFSLFTINLSHQKDLSQLLHNQHQFNASTMLIGAGHDVYSGILRAKKYLEKLINEDIFSIAVLRPSYKLSSFDLVIAPEHDFRKRRFPKNVISFQGSLAATSQETVDEGKALIAIGGLSKHYKFDQEILMKQIHYILSMHPKHEFKIFNSRRTPKELNLKLTDNLGNYQNAKLVHFNSSAPNLFEDCLKESALKFVTPDSTNLVFESLSTQGQTYLVQIEDPSYRRIFGAKKIRDSMNELVLSKRVGVVSILNKKGGVCISKLERPSLHFEPLAEVEKVAFSIMKFMNQQK